jgi:hypothetical protein
MSKKTIYPVILQTVIFFVFSSIPLWAVMLFDNIIKKESTNSLLGILGAFVSICIPILVSGMASSKPTKEKGTFKYIWILHVLAYSLSVIFILATDVVDYINVEIQGGMLSATIIAVIVFVITYYSTYLSYKEKMIKTFNTEETRQEEQQQAEDGAFYD